MTIGLCASCQFCKVIAHPRGGQSYYQCKHPHAPTKYPPLPRLQCEGYEPIVKSTK